MEETHNQLMGALVRMAAGTSVVLTTVRWTKTAWAKEAGVNINTAVAKADGQFVYLEANRLFEVNQLNHVRNRSKKKSVEAQLREENLRLKMKIAELQRRQ